MAAVWILSGRPLFVGRSWGLSAHHCRPVLTVGHPMLRFLLSLSPAGSPCTNPGGGKQYRVDPEGGFAENVIPSVTDARHTALHFNGCAEADPRPKRPAPSRSQDPLAATMNLSFTHGGPPLVNDKLVAKVIEEVGQDWSASDGVQDMHKLLVRKISPSFSKMPRRDVENRG